LRVIVRRHLGNPGPAVAEVNPGNADSYYFPGPYQSQGFTLSATGGFNSYGSNNSGFYAGAKGLAPIGPSDVSLVRTDGGLFSLLSIDLARNFAFDPPPSVTFVGTRAGGGTVQETFTVSRPGGFPHLFETFNFTGFDGLVGVTWTQPAFSSTGPSLHQFTNVSLSTPPPVPEPSGLVLAGVGAVAVAAWRRRGRLQARPI
jgi:hypothetical protein